MMDSVIIHEDTREYVYPINRNCIELRLISSANISCRLVYWNRFKIGGKRVKKTDGVCFARDSRFHYYKCRIAEDEAVKYIRYYFELSDGDEKSYLSTYGLKSFIPQSGFFEYLYTNEKDIFEVPEWTMSAVIYQIFPERFCNGDKTNDPADTGPWHTNPTRENFMGGDIIGIMSKLEYLSELGIDALYINPIFNAPSNHKYDTADYYEIDPAFGSMDAFKQLVDECHRRGIKVILDGVFNHCGYFFVPFQDVLKNGEQSEYKDWFFIESFPVQTDPPNYECVGYYKWMPKLRFSNPEVRQYFLDVGAYWLEQAKIDGWRLDVCDEVDYTFWQEFRKRIKAINKDAVLIGETWKDGRDLLRGDQMDSVMNYLFRDAVADFFAKEAIDVCEFDSRIQKIRASYAPQALPALYNLISSHDTERFLTRCQGNVQKLKLAAAFQMMFTGMPAIYYGDEIGMEGDNDPDCRRAMVWDNMNEKLLAHYKQMIHIRKSHCSITGGDYNTVVCDGGLYGFARRTKDEAVYVVLNNSDEKQKCCVPLFEKRSAIARSLLSSQTYTCRQIEKDTSFFNEDIHSYSSCLDIVISGYSLEIIKIKERN